MMLLTTVSKIKKVWSVAFVPRLLRGDQRCTPVSYAVLRKAHKSTNTSDDGEHDKKGQQNATNYDYIFMARREPTLEKEKNTNDGDNVPENSEDTTSPIVSPPVLTKETQVEKCHWLIEKAFGKHKNKKVSGEPYNVEADNGQSKEVETASLKCDGEGKTRETQVEKCQRIIEKAFGRQKPKRHASDEPYYCTDVDIDETRREIKENAKLKFDDRLVEKPVTDDRVQFGVYRKHHVESSKEDILIPPLEAQTRSSAKRGGTKEPATITDHYEDLNLMQQTLNIYLTPGNQGNEDNMDNTLLPEKPNLIRSTDRIIDAENTLNATATSAPNADPNYFSNYDSFDDTLPLNQSVLEEDIDKYVHKQEQMEEKLFCNMEHMYENAEGEVEDQFFKKSEPIGFGAQSVKHNPDTIPKLKASINPVMSYIYSKSYRLDDDEDPNDPLPCGVEETQEITKPHAQKEEKLAKNVYWNVNTLRDTKTLQATTAKETEEQLTQKVEHIEETPLVEAHKPKIEGFNVTPRVLGDAEPSFNYFKDKRADNQQAGAVPRLDPNSYDEVAKRCLDTPAGKIDEILLKEMEKLGVPMTGRRDSITPSPVIEEDLVQMDVLKKHPRRSTEKKDLEMESQGYERIAEKLFEPRTAYTTQQSVKCNDEVQTSNYEGITPDQKIIIHPNQVLIDPYDKKTIAQDTEEYDADNFYDPTKKFAYFHVPEKKKDGTTLLNKESPSLTKPEVPPTEQKMYDDVDVNDAWDGYQYDGKPELQETHRVYAKWIDNTPSSEAAKMTTNNIWDEERSNPSDNKYAHNFTSTTAEKVPPFSQSKTCGTHNMWHEQYYNPQLQDYVDQNLIKKPDMSDNRTATHQVTQSTQDNSHYNYYNKSHEGYPNTMGSTASHFFVPQNSWDKSMHTHHNMEQVNPTNVNVSDGIWDEQLLEERFVKPEKKGLKLNKDHLQSDSPLAYNATHRNLSPRPQANIQSERPLTSKAHYRDVTPRPQVRAVDTSRIALTDFEYEHDHPEIYPDIQLNITQAEEVEKSHEEKSYEEKMKKVATFLQADAIWESTRMNTTAMNAANFHAAAMPAPSIPDTLNTLPKLNEAVSLTELLRRVRERSRIIECKNELKALGVQVDTIEGKCGSGKVSTRCPAMSPRVPSKTPISPPNIGLPQLKQRPPMCRPKRKPRTTKCSTCEMDMSLGLRLGPQIAQAPIVCPEMVCEMNLAGAMEISLSRSRADLTDDIIDRLQTLGKILGVVLRQGKTEVLESAVVRHRRGPNVVLARNYEPWAPIPSWPTPKKTKRKEPPCEPGCKIFPPTRAILDPPCDQRPCQGFPKKTFAVLDCFAVSLGENKVYDLGEF